MKTSNVLLDKSLLFSARIVRLYQYLLKNKHETVISEQEGDSLLTDCLEIKRILVSTKKSAKDNPT